jgi:hypothetical protein
MNNRFTAKLKRLPDAVRQTFYINIPTNLSDKELKAIIKKYKNKFIKHGDTHDR